MTSTLRFNLGDVCRAKSGQLSLRGVSKELAARGFFNELGKPFAAKSSCLLARHSIDLRPATRFFRPAIQATGAIGWTKVYSRSA
jgi:hypothetical protein